VNRPDAGDHGPELLTGLRVLELGDGISGAAATRILGLLGAEVTSVANFDSMHRRGGPQVTVAGRSVSLLSVCLDRFKQIVESCDTNVDDLLDSGHFDLVVVDRVAASSTGPAAISDVSQYLEYVERHQSGAWVSLSAFGLSGPRAGERLTDLTLAAASGMLLSVRDPATGRPLKMAGQQSLLVAGQAAALAACHALDRATAGSPAHLDLAAVEAAIAMGPVLEVGGLLLNTGAVGGARRYGAPAGNFDCADGVVRISAMEDHQWQGIVTAMGTPGWAQRFAETSARIEDADMIDEHVADWTRERSKFDVETLLQSNGVPATAVRAGTEVLESPQALHRGVVDSITLDEGTTAGLLGSPFRVVARSEPSHDAPRRSLRSLRVLEIGHVLAAPLCGAVLGALGCEVTKLEDLKRLDMYRRRGPYIDDEPGADRSAYFALMNHSKQSVAFAVDQDLDRLAGLLTSSEVVIENVGRKRAATLGVAASVALDEHPHLLAISSTGFGQSGPFADYRAYAYNVHAASGLGHLTRSADGASASIDVAWADLITAYSLATLVAAWAVAPLRAPGLGIDFAMADLVASQFNEFVAAASIDPGVDADFERANDQAPYGPHGVYATLDGWVALAVATDEQFARLVELLGDARLSTTEFRRSSTRLERRRELDHLIEQVTRNRSGAELAAALRVAGISAERVLSGADLVADPQLADRGFLTTVSHPVWGERQLVGIPWRPIGDHSLKLGPPPLFAPDTENEPSQHDPRGD
jgi:crotonobetainyl-CoA:carnitine CoA-transferase CaiB-like acyl-CoA transferase